MTGKQEARVWLGVALWIAGPLGWAYRIRTRRGEQTCEFRPALSANRGKYMRISLCGAAGEVTGSGYLVQTATATVLVDFGMFQGRGATEARNLDLGPVKPLDLDAIVVTHAHLDRHGPAAALAVPRLSRQNPHDARDDRLHAARSA